MERFDIYLRGFFGSEPAEDGLQRAFGLDRKRAFELVSSLPRVVKRDVPGEQAARYHEVLTALGADFELRRSPIRPHAVITVVGGSSTRAASDDLDLPPPSWPLPLPTPPQPAQPPPVVMYDSRALGATWSESRPPPRPPAPPPGPSLGDTLSESRADPPVALRTFGDTLVEARPAPAAPAVPASMFSRALGATRPESQAPPAPPAAEVRAISVPPPPAPPSSAPPPAASSPAPPAAVAQPSSAWAPIPPADLKAAPVRSGGPPAAWRAAAFDVDVSHGWRLDVQSAASPQDSGASLPVTVHDPFDPPPSLAPGARAAAKPRAPRAPSAFVVQSSGAPPARESREAVVAGRPGHASAVGLVAGRELARDEPSPLLRWMIRVGLGLSLFVIVTTARHCHAIETGVDDALARWTGPGTSASEHASAPGVDTSLGPAALPWLEPDLHLVSNGDKDRVRGLAQRFTAAGALGVYVGTITKMGMTEVAGELIVQLPADPATRKAVLTVYDDFLASSFGGVAVAGAEPTGDLLRVTL